MSLSNNQNNFMEGAPNVEINESGEKREKIRDILGRVDKALLNEDGSEKEGIKKILSIAGPAAESVIQLLKDKDGFRKIEAEYISEKFTQDNKVKEFESIVDRIITETSYIEKRMDNLDEIGKEWLQMLIDTGIVPNREDDIEKAKDLGAELGLPEEKLDFK